MLIDRLRLIMLILILPFVLTLFLYVKGYLSLKLFRVFLAALGVLYVIVRVRLILTKSAKVIKCAKVCHSACSGGLDQLDGLECPGHGQCAGTGD